VAKNRTDLGCLAKALGLGFDADDLPEALIKMARAAAKDLYRDELRYGRRLGWAGVVFESPPPQPLPRSAIWYQAGLIAGMAQPIYPHPGFPAAAAPAPVPADAAAAPAAVPVVGGGPASDASDSDEDGSDNGNDDVEEDDDDSEDDGKHVHALISHHHFVLHFTRSTRPLILCLSQIII
jgi:hypothetical protein